MKFRTYLLVLLSSWQVFAMPSEFPEDVWKESLDFISDSKKTSPLQCEIPSGDERPSCLELSGQEVLRRCHVETPDEPMKLVSPQHEYGICEEFGIGPFKKRDRYKVKAQPYKLGKKDGKIFLSQRIIFDSRKVKLDPAHFRAALVEIIAETKRFYARQGIEYELEWKDRALGEKYSDEDQWKPLEMKFKNQLGLSNTEQINFGEYVKNGSLFTEPDPRVPGKLTVHGRLVRTFAHELLHEMGLPDDYVPPENLPVNCRHHYNRRNLTRHVYIACDDPLTQGPFCDNVMLGGQVLQKAVLPPDYLSRLISPLCKNVCSTKEPLHDKKDEAKLFDSYNQRQFDKQASISYDRGQILSQVEKDVLRAKELGFNDWAQAVMDASGPLREESQQKIDLGLQKDGQTVRWNKLISPISYQYILMPETLRKELRP